MERTEGHNRGQIAAPPQDPSGRLVAIGFVFGVLVTLGCVWTWDAGRDERTLCTAYDKLNADAALHCMSDKLGEAREEQRKEAIYLDDLSQSILKLQRQTRLELGQ